MEMKSLFDNVKIGWLDLADAQTEISVDEKKLDPVWKNHGGNQYSAKLDCKRPARYMSQAFSEKIRDFLKNYLDSGFQNGGSRESI